MISEATVFEVFLSRGKNLCTEIYALKMENLLMYDMHICCINFCILVLAEC